jgi:aryl-alcohol dehydrogenase-like predicted oxidoreductase
MLTRRLGRTGHESSVAILGGAAFARSNPDEAAAAFSFALDAGVNHLDIAPSYGDAERLVGPLVPAARDRLFVACKTGRHNAEGVRTQLEESLTLLGCESFDLYQLHGVTDLDELDRRTDAAAEILRARDEGLTRFVGITGHNLSTPRAQAEALRRWDLDTVMFPVYPRLWVDADYRRDAEALLELCASRDVGVMAIKAAAARPWTEGADHHATTWYEPQTSRDAIERGVRFALSTPGVHAFCTPGDIALMRTAIEIASSFVPFDDEAARLAAANETADEPVIFPIPS